MMKFNTLILVALCLLSFERANPSPSDTNTPSIDDLIPVVINEHLHHSLPADWINEYQKIMTNLKNLLPLYQIYYHSIDIYAWNDKVHEPYPGIKGGAYISLNNSDKKQKLFVVEISNHEFLQNHMHRYSVIAHEYFHTYQMAQNKHANKYDNHPTSFKTKWIIEGSAASFESIYIQQHYSKNYFLSAQNQVNLEAIQNPNIFENYNSYKKDTNYSSSVFLVLVLAKELQLAGHTEDQSFRLILKDFMQGNPNKMNWKRVFQTTFNISVSDFYTKASKYQPSIRTVLPSSSLTLESIFN